MSIGALQSVHVGSCDTCSIDTFIASIALSPSAQGTQGERAEQLRPHIIPAKSARIDPCHTMVTYTSHKEQ
jgi:hypothetical protein